MYPWKHSKSLSLFSFLITECAFEYQYQAITNAISSQADMTHCYDLMKERAVLGTLDTGAEKVWIQEEKRHHAHMMKINDEWNKEVRGKAMPK